VEKAKETEKVDIDGQQNGSRGVSGTGDLAKRGSNPNSMSTIGAIRSLSRGAGVRTRKDELGRVDIQNTKFPMKHYKNGSLC